jgi:queuine/archaeosine tRNA-ribosyltransferase
MKNRNKILNQPVVWIGYDLDHQVRIWNYGISKPRLMLNAYQIVKMPMVLKKINDFGITDHLEIDTQLFIDSGGYLFQKSGKSSISNDELAILYNRINPNLFSSLDIPLDPKLTSIENRKRWETTISNFKNLNTYVHFQDSLVPILHSYNEKNIQNRINNIISINNNPPFIGIGSLVPLFKYGLPSEINKPNSRTIALWKFIQKLIDGIKESDNKVHIFGAGSINSILLLSLMGADSFDTTGWRLKAAYGQIQLPGIGDRTLSNKNIAPFLKVSEKSLLVNCSCPVCSNQNFENKVKELSNSFVSRCVHNVYTITNMIESFNRINSFEERLVFVNLTLQNHPLRRVVENIIYS